jgi:hypothetical protein
VNVPWQPVAGTRGLLLVGGGPASVAAWVRRGLVACQVVPLGRWTAVVPAERVSRARPPYDDAVTVLAARRVPHRLRPCIGAFTSGGRAVLTVQPRGWRGGQRWLVWEPGRGVVTAPGLAPARPVDLVRAAAGGRGLGGVLADPRGDAELLLRRVWGALGLPGVELLADGGSGRVVTPSATAVSRFEARVAEDARHRAELEEG